MIIKINDTMFSVNEEKLAELNDVVKRFTHVTSKYCHATEKYSYEPTGKTVQFQPVQEIQSIIS